MKLDIEVTDKELEEAAPGSEFYCAVATAIGRLVPEANRIEVNVHTIRFTLPRKGSETYSRFVYRSPPEVAEYVRLFDEGAKLKPMSFTLDKPQIAERTPAPSNRAKTPSFKPQSTAKTRRSVRVRGEKAFQ